MRNSHPHKATFDLAPEVARALKALKEELQFDYGLPASEASGVGIVSALILNAKASGLARLLRGRSRGKGVR